MIFIMFNKLTKTMSVIEKFDLWQVSDKGHHDSNHY